MQSQSLRRAANLFIMLWKIKELLPGLRSKLSMCGPDKVGTVLDKERLW